MIKRFSAFLSSAALGEVKGPGNHRLPVDDHDFVVGDSMGRIDIGWNPDVGQESGRSVLYGPLALVQNGLNLDPRLWAERRALAIGTEVKE